MTRDSIGTGSNDAGSFTYTTGDHVLKILVAEDHYVVRHGIRQLLGSRPDWQIVGEARTGRQALELARRTPPDVAVLDLSLPELAGVEVIGARAYVLKSEPGARLLDAVDALSRGEPFFSPRVASLVLKAFVHARDSGGPGADPLTRREREVAQLLVEGLGSRAVASRLEITPKTVDTHRAAIMRKLGMSTLADLVRYAIRNRLVEP